MAYTINMYYYDKSAVDYKNPIYSFVDENGEELQLDLSKFVLTAGSDCDNLDDTLNTCEFTLMGVPFRTEFEPSAKFIIDFVQDEQIVKTLHMVVDNDSVSQPIISDDTYFTHTISFIEPSVIAQQRPVDNMSITYRLKDVTINEVPTFDAEKTATIKKVNSEQQNPIQFGYSLTTGSYKGTYHRYVIGHKFEWVMPNWYKVTIGGESVTPSWSYWDEFKNYQQIGSEPKVIELPVPMLRCYFGVPGSTNYSLNGYCSLNVKVTKTSMDGTVTVVKDFDVNPCATNLLEGKWDIDSYKDYEKDAYVSLIKENGYINSSFIFNYGQWEKADPSDIFGVARYSKVTEWDDIEKNRVISFTAEKGYIYNVSITRKVFDKSDVYNPYEKIIGLDLYDKYPNYYAFSYYYQAIFSFNNGISYQLLPTQDTNPLVSMDFEAIDAVTTNSYFFKRPITLPTAYDLYLKATLITPSQKKVKGTPIESTINTFYVRKEDIENLNNTIIIESFYHQKNLWEIQMEVGKYIHARPYTMFGDDDRLLTLWKKYGQTEVGIKSATKMSVYNSKFVQEYISSMTSYVTNMVQLGGAISETVVPKSMSETYLVYNDVAEIIVSKNIIELVSIKAIKNSTNEEADMTPYVYEKNIYELLSINKNTLPNKGIALYYELGTNRIRGLNYTLPQKNTGTELYAIKNILSTIFAINNPTAIKVNDYRFVVTYRTKDSLRADQSRPDLRKYMLNSKHDAYPLHSQFNNQTDTVLDANKFGNNLYGKLIRTGNTIYTMVEWLDTPINIKASGELYTIDGNMYYVAKVKNTYYPDHIISEVEFSKDFNRLSEIIGIPSEPRFYEISEQSQINREVQFNEFLVLSTDIYDGSFTNTTVKGVGMTYVSGILSGIYAYKPNYAITYFKSDSDKTYMYGNDSFETEILSPINIYSIENVLTIEWDMVDNFSAGDQVKVVTDSGITDVDKAYNTLQPYRYCDIFGRADMYDFAIIEKRSNFTIDEARALPQNTFQPEIAPYLTTTNYDVNTIITSGNSLDELKSNTHGIILLKDNREKLSFNYNLQMLTDSDRFVLSPYMWSMDKKSVKLAFLTKEVNKLSRGIISNNDIAFTTKSYIRRISATNYINIDIFSAVKALKNNGTITDADLERIVAIAVYDESASVANGETLDRYFILARNVGGLDSTLQTYTSEKYHSWYISAINENLFAKKQ